MPDILQQHRAGNNLFGPPHQIFQQIEFTRQQLDAAPVAHRPALDQIQRQVAELKRRLRVSSGGRNSASIRAANSENANGFVR